MHVDHRLAKGVDFGDPIEPLQAVGGVVEVFAYFPRLVVRIERQLAEALVGVVVVAVLHGLQHRVALGLIGRGRRNQAAGQQGANDRRTQQRGRFEHYGIS